MFNRRSVLRGMSYAVTSSALGGSLIAAEAQPDGMPAPQAAAESNAGSQFSFESLSERMQELATRPFQPPAAELSERLAKLTYDRYRAIAFRPERALWADSESEFQLHAFHLGWLFREPVRLFEVVEGVVSPITFSGSDFEYRPPLDAEDFRDMVMPGVAGFRLHYPLNRPDVSDEIIVFQGASYFRALGRGNVYGISARGIAVNTATSSKEEFPRFTEFYIARPGRGDKRIVIYAALDGPSLTGAFAFHVVPGRETINDVSARLFFRSDIERLGIAPMTSMFLFGSNNRSAFDDYRAQVHDSNGLKIIRSNGDELWRCLNNPSLLANSFFEDETPASFALLQRDREFADYQDAEARYERRPSLKVEPLNDWGRGAIQLVEIPSDLEQDDNIVAFWTPDREIKAGQSLDLQYRLAWGDLPTEPDTSARIIATRTGIGGPSGVKNEDGLRKFVVDFQGGPLADLADEVEVVAVNEVVGGEVTGSSLSRVMPGDIWRLAFDVRPTGREPMELRAYLEMANRLVSETWLYQWRPGDEKRRA